MRILITGISGFVGRHFLNMLEEENLNWQVAGIYNNNVPSFSANEFQNLDCSFKKLNLLDKNATAEFIQQFKPHYILHLAAPSSVAASWKNPAGCISDITTLFLNIIEAVRINQLDCKILSVGSAEEYGPAKAGEKLKEDMEPDPVNPYGAARMLQSRLAKIYSLSYGMDIVHTRSFNHFGPGQKPVFAIASFAKQIADGIENGEKDVAIDVGNLNVVRDFLDVRDVVKAYKLLLLQGKKGEVYNVCSSKAIPLQKVIDEFEKIISVKINYNVQETALRPLDNPFLEGDNTKLICATNWRPRYSLKESLIDTLNYWRNYKTL